MLKRLSLSLPLLLAACSPTAERQETAATPDFPAADRPVSALGATAFADEDLRDSRQEAATVMQLAGVSPGMSVADIGAGEGYYTVRLAEAVGPEGRVLAQDIDRGALLRLGDRVERERLDNVSVVNGLPDDPRLPEGSFDRIFLVHMYHEVSEPYAFLWRLHPALRAGGQIVVVETDRVPDKHGIPPQLLFCEFGQVGFRLVEFVRHPALAGYYAQFEVLPDRPQPDEIRPCTIGGTADVPAANDRGIRAPQ
jgi:ubiquinone/menaquinone biosynthesis C-methylase UbiE